MGLEIRKVNVVRYVTPLREGGSLPALVEADDGFLYVLKFKGAGQGCKALVSELIGGELARHIGLNMPELVFADLDASFGRSEGDEEIQDLLKFSVGLNLGMSYLSGAITFDPSVHEVDSETASKIIWLDAFLTNVDRTARNTNLLHWNKETWLIDHGAALYFHHAVGDITKQAESKFVQIKNHVLLPFSEHLDEVDVEMKEKINTNIIENIVDAIPEDWLIPNDKVNSPEAWRDAYKTFLNHRLSNADHFFKTLKQAKDGRI